MDKRIFVEEKSWFSCEIGLFSKRITAWSSVENLEGSSSCSGLRCLCWQKICLRVRKTYFQSRWPILFWMNADWSPENYAFFAVKACLVNLTSRRIFTETLLLLGSSNDVTVNTAQLYLVNKDIDARWVEAVKNLPLDSGFSFQKISLLALQQDFSETIPSLDFFEIYGRKIFAV